MTETTRLRILCVEDDTAFANLIQQYIDRIVGILADTTVVNLMADARHALEADQWDIVILDLSLPDSSLDETLQFLKEQANQSAIVVLTSSDSESLGREAVRSGAQDFLVKGKISRELLGRSIQYAIERHSLAKQLQASRDAELRSIQARANALALINERLADIDRLKSKFMTDMSHELRTPITTMKLYLSLMQHGKEARQADYLNVLNQQVSRLETLSEDVLVLVQLDSLEEAATIESMNIVPLCASTTEQFRPTARQKGLTLNFVPRQPSIIANIEFAHVVMIVEKLLENALTYTETGSVSVSIAQDEAASQAIITINDTGLGISEADLPHIFKRFYRGEGVGSSNIPGNGLGLPIVHAIVSRYQGTIHVESELDRGTDVRILLPAS